jgi:hypothetical protein
MYRFAILLALLVALAAAGCGGSGDDSDTPASAVAQATESEPSDDSGGSSSDEDAKKEKTDADDKQSDDEATNEAEDDDAPKTEADVREETKESFATLPAKDRSAALESVLRASLLRFGLTLADVETRDRGRKATAILARKGVCNFVAGQEANLVLTIKENAPWLKTVRFEVAGTGEELGYYVLGCEKPEIPSGAGRVVLDHSGVNGPYKSKVFTIKSKRWALEWVNEAASLAVLVEAVGGESEGEYFKPVGSQKAESGRYEYVGRGTFQITAYGAGGWRVRVKEIG